MILPPLGMTDDNEARPQIGPHVRADIASEGAVGAGMAILPAQRNRRSEQHLAHRWGECRRWADGEIDLPQPTRARDYGLHLRKRRAQAVHFPVSGYQLAALGHALKSPKAPKAPLSPS